MHSSVKLSVAWLTLICVILLVPGVWLVKSSENAAQTTIAFGLFALVAAIVTFGFLGSSGLVRTRGYQFGGAAAIFLVTLIILLNTRERSVEITGRVDVDGHLVGTGKIRVLAEISDPVHDLKDPPGQFKFSNIPPDGKTLEFVIMIDGFEEVSVKRQFTVSKPIIISLSRSNLFRIPAINSFQVKPGTDARLTAYGYGAPPIVAASIVANRQRPMLQARFGKLRMAPNDNELFALDDAEVSVEQQSYDGWKAVIDTGKVINSRFKGTPHGSYIALVSLTSQAGGLKSTNFNLNYVYDLKSGGELLEGSTDRFMEAGPEIDAFNTTKTKTNFISARLKQDFDFKTDFIVCGSFLMSNSNLKKAQRGVSPAFDVSFGNNSGDLVSVIMGEDNGDSYSIKVRNEAVRKAGPKPLINKVDDTGTHINKSGTKPNFFAIRFTRRRTKEVMCSLFVAPYPTDPTEDDPIFERPLESSVLGDGVTKIRLKLWQLGTIRITSLEIAEMPTKMVFAAR